MVSDIGRLEGFEAYHTDGGNGGDDLTKLELVEDGGFTGGIKTNHQNSHLLLPPQTVEKL